MKILFDHQTFTQQEFGGISRYFFELIKRLNEVEGVKANCPLVFSNNDYISNSPFFSRSTFFKGKKLKGKIRLMNYVNSTYSSLKLRLSDYEIFHPTYYDTYYLKKSVRSPIVITCLDLIHEKFIADDTTTILKKEAVLRRADVIIAISESTKRDLISIYGLPSEKIHVIHLANSLGTPRVSDIHLGPPYLLYVGMRNLYKNFAFFLEATAPILRKGDLNLICAGGGQFTKEELSLIEKLNLIDKVKFEHASDYNLQKLYSNAVVFIYPSKYEGFGIPVLEAMACGCPVVCSNTSSLPEVGGTAALYFDPNDMNSIHQTVLNVIDNNIQRELMKKSGLLRVTDFSWDKTAHETLTLYKSLV